MFATSAVEWEAFGADLLPEPEALTTSTTFKCLHPLCSCEFVTRGNLTKHYRITGHLPDWDDHEMDTTEALSRKSYTNTFKRDKLRLLDKYITENIPAPYAATARDPHPAKVDPSLISKWNDNRVLIFDIASAHGCALKRANVSRSSGAFPIAEGLLYARFLYTRTVDQLRVGHSWLRTEMLDIVKRLNPDNKAQTIVDKFVAAHGWSTNFSKRWHLSSQCRTNKHSKPIALRLPAIEEFHKFLHYEMQGRQPYRSARYGRFPPERVFHLDQVPLPFCSDSQQSMNPTGEQCTIKQPGGSGLSKRFCTLQVCICACAGKQCVKIEIYFKGKGNVGQDELDFFAKFDNLIIRFNDKAWSDEKTAISALVAFREQTLHLGEVLLGMDGHAAQITPFCRAFMDHMGIRYAITTPNCTDLISPVDRHVGAALKAKIEDYYEQALRTNAKLWTLSEAQGGLSASRKRILVATWTSLAWTDLCRDNQYCIERAFIETGFMLANDGSDRLEVRPYKNPKKRRRANDTAPNHRYTNMSPEGLPYDFGPPSKVVKRS